MCDKCTTPTLTGGKKKLDSQSPYSKQDRKEIQEENKAFMKEMMGGKKRRKSKRKTRRKFRRRKFRRRKSKRKSNRK